jgi:hypothetical protein
VGFRAEFRWDRFSFAFTDFYGYDDFPYADQVFRYERNVDPFSGRPRRNMSRGSCILDVGMDGVDDGASSTRDAPGPAGGVFTGEADCLAGGVDALVNHHANQQLFAFICSTSIGFTTLDPSVCAQSVFNSSTVVSGFPISEVLGLVLTGDPTGVGIGAALVAALAGPIAVSDIPFVDLGLADRDGVPGYSFATDNPVNNGLIPGFPHLDNHLSAAQRALLGCGPYYGQADGGAPARPCSVFGIDLLNAEASALTSAWITQPGVQGTSFLNLTGPAPGTVPWYAANGRFNCQRHVEDIGLVILPGCRAPGEPGYNPLVDYDPANIGVKEAGGALPNNGVGTASALITSVFDCGVTGGMEGAGTEALPGGFCGTGNPFTGEAWYSTMDGFSWNFQMLLVVFSAIGATGQDGIAGTPDDFLDVDTFDPTNPMDQDKCSWVAPQFCSNISALLSVMGRRRNTVEAGGTRRFGRHDFVWHGGSSNRLKWDKRNVLGFSMDFAEDVTKTNWSVEATWIHDLTVADNDTLDGVTDIDQYNLTVSVDRPTFINFLNQGRTFFINSQWFFRYEDGWEASHPRNGPWNVLFTLTAFTGFYQDRLNPSITHVYDFMSESGAVLPSISYRFSESFSAEFGMAIFYGKWQSTRMPLVPIALSDHAGSGAYRAFSERGLALVRDRDEVFLRIRKTF